MDASDKLQELEEALWRSVTRGDHEWMDSVLAPDFAEHGRSGRVYDREASLAVDVPEVIEIELPLTDFNVRAISEDVALVTYVSVEPRGRSNRSSLWRHDGSRWLLEFHQGTPS